MEFKRGVLILVVLLLTMIFLFSSASAIDIQLSKEIYEPAETLQAEISGAIIENIKYEDISFYSDRKKVIMVYDIAKINEKYYLYALLPYVERNYTLLIRDVLYKKQGLAVTETLSKNFSIKQASNHSLSFSPGFIITQKDFSIKLENKGKELVAEALFEATNEKKQVQLSEEESKKVSFSVSGIKNYTESKIQITAQSQSYSLPVFVIPQSEINISDTQNISKLTRLEFVPHSKNITIKKDNPVRIKPFILVNLGDVNLTNIEISIGDIKYLNVVISPDNITKLEPNDKEDINISIMAEKQGIFVLKIKAKAGNVTASAIVQINSTSEEVNYSDDGDYEPVDERNCSMKGGKICKSDETCKGEKILTIDGACCLGECAKTGGKSSTKWIGFVLFFVVVVVVILVLIKIKKQKARKPEEILKSKAKTFEHGTVELQGKK